MRPGRLITAWSAAAVLLALGTSIAMAQSPAPTVAPPARVAVDAAALRMTPITLPSELPFAPLEAVTAGGPGWVAVGATVPQEVGPVDTLVLTSTDGSTWSQVPLGDLAQVGSLSDVVAFQAGLVAVGSVWDPNDRQHAIAVASADGLTWQASTDRDLRNAYMSGIAAWGDGVAAVGCRLGADGLCDRPSVWTSVDGLEWDRVAMPRSAGEPNAVASGDGLLVVMGVSSAIADGRPVISTTRDLSTWTRRELGFEGSLGPAVIKGDQVFAAGTLIDQDGDVLRRGIVVFSPNAGRRWVRMPLTAPAGSSFEGLSMDGPVITVGSRENAELEASPAAWFSRLGVDWTRIRGVRSSVLGYATDFAAFPDRAGGIAVGGVGELGGGAAIWMIQAPG
jgi:hypothetical protein